MFFKKKPAPGQPMRLGYQGMDVHVNPPSAMREKRNEARIGRIKLAMEHMKKNGQRWTDRYRCFKAELKVRLAQQKIDRERKV